MEFIHSSSELFFSTLTAMNLQNGAGAMLLLIVSGFVLYSGFPVAFGLAGTAIAFAIYALVGGAISGEEFTPFSTSLENLLISKTLLSLPLFYFTAVMIERASIVENLIHKFIDHWQQKSEAMLFTVSLFDILVSALAAIICSLFAPHVALRLPQLLQTKNHHLLEKNSIASLFSKGPLNNKGFIPITVCLVLITELLTVSNVFNAHTKTTFTASDFFIAALLPGLLFICLFSFYHLCLMFKYPNDYVFKNQDKVRGAVSSTKKELLKTLLVPGAFVTIIVSSLLIFKLPILEVATIAAVGSIFLASHKLAPEKNYIYLNSVISFLGLCLLNKLFILDVNKFEFSPLNGAILAISIFLIGYISYGIFMATTALHRLGLRNTSNYEATFLNRVLQDTLAHSAKLITIFITALLYILVFKALGGDQLIKLLYENMGGNINLAIMITILILFSVAKIFTPFVALLITIPILIPSLVLAAKTMGTEMSIVWLGVIIIISLQFLGLYVPEICASEKQENAQNSLEAANKQIFQTKIPFILIQIIILVVCWLFPHLVLGLGAAI